MILLAQLEKGMDRLFLPLGLLYTADALEQNGEKVEVFHEHGTEENINLLLQKVKKDQPKWVGFSVATGPQLLPTIEASKRIKTETDTSIIWGGIHPTVVPNVDVEPYIDVAVRGEGEAWISSSPVTDMDKYQPTWHLIDAERYGTTIHLITSRGCPYRCGFCYSPLVWKRKWKAHSIGKVVEIFESYPIQPVMVEFRDDYFFADKKRAIDIVNRLNVPWIATMRAPDVTLTLLNQLKVPPSSISIGVESASQRLLDLIHKDVALEDVEKALQNAETYGINLYCSFIIGLPTETLEEREATINLAGSIQKQYSNVVCDVKPYRCYPGTALYELSVNLGFTPPHNTEEWAKYALKVWTIS